ATRALRLVNSPPSPFGAPGPVIRVVSASHREFPLDRFPALRLDFRCFSLLPREFMTQKEGTRSKRSRWLFLGGIASIVLGFGLLAMGDRYVAPFLLVGGYLVLVPLSFIA